jgi:hypothetical protein
MIDDTLASALSGPISLRYHQLLNARSWTIERLTEAQAEGRMTDAIRHRGTILALDQQIRALLRPASDRAPKTSTCAAMMYERTDLQLEPRL